MKQRKKTLKLKKFNIHPIIGFIILSVITVLLSCILSKVQFQATYNEVNVNTLELETKLVTVENLLNFNGMKFIISNAAKNFAGFTPLSSLLIALIGLAIASASGLIDAFAKRITINWKHTTQTFLVLLLATISSLINDVGYVILIPLCASLYKSNKRNPMLGIITAFCGITFGYGATIFVGSSEVALIPITTSAARLVDATFHISLTSNIFIMILTTIITSIVGTIVIEKIIAPKVGRIKQNEDDMATKEIDITQIKETEQNKIEINVREQKGIKESLIWGIIFMILFAYMLIPGLPLSGMLLDKGENTYLKQLFGENAYFQDGFTYMISLFFIVTGIAYGVCSKTIKNIKDLFNKCSSYLNNIGLLLVMIFFASQFVSIFKKSNIGNVIVALSSRIISHLPFSGVPLIIIVMLMVAICSIFVTTANTKWSILAPVVVPLMMQSNISPQFAQFILRAADSMTKGITPLLAYFVIYVGYLNIYNNKEGDTISIKKSISYVMPYCLIMALCWILIIIGWYILGAPIGLGVSSTL